MKCGLKKPVSVTPGMNSYHTNGATSIKSPFTERNIPLNATITTTTIKMVRLPSVDPSWLIAFHSRMSRRSSALGVLSLANHGQLSLACLDDDPRERQDRLYRAHVLCADAM